MHPCTNLYKACAANAAYKHIPTLTHTQSGTGKKPNKHKQTRVKGTFSCTANRTHTLSSGRISATVRSAYATHDASAEAERKWNRLKTLLASNMVYCASEVKTEEEDVHGNI